MTYQAGQYLSYEEVMEQKRLHRWQCFANFFSGLMIGCIIMYVVLLPFAMRIGEAAHRAGELSCH